MSVRRWIGMGGIVVAVAAGAVGTGRVGSGSAFEARAFLRLEGPHSTNSLLEPLIDERERFLDSPEVRELVRSRLGETPPAWATATADDTVLVRSRGATPEQAAKATETYAASYVDVDPAHRLDRSERAAHARRDDAGAAPGVADRDAHERTVGATPLG